MMNRRKLLQLAAVAPFMCYQSSVLAQKHKAEVLDKDKMRYLLLVELHGGNDSLNMCVPYSQNVYYESRPSIAVPKQELIRLNEHIGLNGIMAPLEPIWEAAELAVLPGIGYPKPNRSHFRSIEIWDTASDSDEYLDNGWLGEMLVKFPLSSRMAAQGIVLGRNPAPLISDNVKMLVMNDRNSFIKQAARLREVVANTNNLTLKHLLDVTLSAKGGGERLHAGVKMKGPKGTKNFKSNNFLKDIHEVIGLIKSHVGAPVYKVSLSGFDTHANQIGQHQVLLKQLSEGLAYLRLSLKDAGMWDQVLVMTYSEFGRRVTENSSQGTDHGTAATHFLLGGRVRGGIRSAMPNLSDLQNKDLQHTLDFRSIYASVVDQWMKGAITTQLKGFEQISILN